jgi:hypothetical protein
MRNAQKDLVLAGTKRRLKDGDPDMMQFLSLLPSFG